MQIVTVKGFSVHVSLAVRVTDALSGRPVAAARVRDAAGGRRAIQKPDGFHVLTGLPEGPALVEAAAPGYRPSLLLVQRESLSPLMPVLTMSLAQERPRTSVLHVAGRAMLPGGRPAAGARVRAVPEAAQYRWKLSLDAPEGAEALLLYNPRGADISGASFLLCTGEPPREALLSVQGANMQGEARLTAPVPFAAPRMRSYLIELAQTGTLPDGSFCLQLRPSGTPSVLRLEVSLDGLCARWQGQTPAAGDVELGDLMLKEG